MTEKEDLDDDLIINSVNIMTTPKKVGQKRPKAASHPSVGQKCPRKSISDTPSRRSPRKNLVQCSNCWHLGNKIKDLEVQVNELQEMNNCLTESINRGEILHSGMFILYVLIYRVIVCCVAYFCTLQWSFHCHLEKTVQLYSSAVDK